MDIDSNQNITNNDQNTSEIIVSASIIKNDEIIVKVNDPPLYPLNDDDQLLENNNNENITKDEKIEDIEKDEIIEDIKKDEIIEDIKKDEIKEEKIIKKRGEKIICLFDVDGTICEHGQNIKDDMFNEIFKLKQRLNCELGIIGGGKYERICEQLYNQQTLFKYIFSECGSVYYKDDKMIKNNVITRHKAFPIIQKLIRHSLKFISETNYEISGHFVDVRNGLVYISLVGLQANKDQREIFIKSDKKMDYRGRLLVLLNERKDKYIQMSQNKNLQITCVLGGQTGITIYPSEWDKVQSLNYLNEYDEIHYFGDRYEEDGNDHKLINHEKVIGHKVNSVKETLDIIQSIF